MNGDRPIPEKLGKQNQIIKFTPTKKTYGWQFIFRLIEYCISKIYQRSTIIVIFVSIDPFCKVTPISFDSMNEIGNLYFQLRS